MSYRPERYARCNIETICAGARFALHLHRQHLDLHQRKAPREHAQHVAHRGARGRGQHREAAHEGGQGALALGLEQAFGGQLLFQFFERAAQRAFAGFLQRIQDQLVVAARLVQREAAAREHAQAFARDEVQPLALRLEQGAAHLGARILQREVEVPGARPREVAQFALDPHQREGAFQQVARQRVELAGREDLAGVVAFHSGVRDGGTR